MNRRLIHILVATVVTASVDRTIRVWDARTGQLRQQWPQLPVPPHRAALSHDRALLAVGCFDGSLYLFDARAGARLESLFSHQRRLNALVFSTDGQTLAAAGNDYEVRWWQRKSPLPWCS